MRTAAFYLSLVLIFTIACENIADIENLGTVSRGLGLLTGAVWLAAVVSGGRFRNLNGFHLALCLFFLWNVASIFWTTDPEATLDRAKTYAQLALLGLILWDLYDTESALRAGLQAYVLGAYITIASTVHNYLLGVQGGYQRYTGAGFNADDLGVVLALGVPVAWYLNIAAGGAVGALRWLNYAYIPAATFGIILSGTRTALIAAVPAIFFIVASFPRTRLALRVGVFSFLVVAALVLQPFIPQASLQRLGTIGSELTEGDLNGRIAIWREGVSTLLTQPLTGVGSGAYREGVGLGKVAHNTFLSVTVETGLIGAALFALVLVLAARAAVSQTKPHVYFWLAVLAVWALGAFALSYESRKPTWLFLNLAVIAAYVPARRGVTAAAPAAPAMTVKLR